MHLGINAVVVDMPAGPRVDNFARILNSYLANVHNSTKFMLRVQVPADFDNAELAYSKYVQIKQLCGHTQGLQAILEFGSDLPDFEAYLKRWTGEKIYAVQLHTKVFLSNAKGFPVLSKKHQQVCKYLMRLQVRFILRSRHPNDNLDHYYQYLCHMFDGHDSLDQEEKIEISYRNYLQSPLQPLADNLESATYETFENDTIKYDLYEESLVKALVDFKKYGRFF